MLELVQLLLSNGRSLYSGSTTATTTATTTTTTSSSSSHTTAHTPASWAADEGEKQEKASFLAQYSFFAQWDLLDDVEAEADDAGDGGGERVGEFVEEDSSAALGYGARGSGGGEEYGEGSGVGWGGWGLGGRPEVELGFLREGGACCGKEETGTQHIYASSY